ncbi:hypothetical protein V8F33_008329 [Rhypophila sp. PSN 637]
MLLWRCRIRGQHRGRRRRLYLPCAGDFQTTCGAGNQINCTACPSRLSGLPPLFLERFLAAAPLTLQNVSFLARSRECDCGFATPTVSAPASECTVACSSDDNELHGAGMRLSSGRQGPRLKRQVCRDRRRQSRVGPGSHKEANDIALQASTPTASKCPKSNATCPAAVTMARSVETTCFPPPPSSSRLTPRPHSRPCPASGHASRRPTSSARST